MDRCHWKLWGAALQGGLVIVRAVYGVAEAVDALLTAFNSPPGGEPEGSEPSTSAAAATVAGGGHDPSGEREDEDRCEAVHGCCAGL